MARSRNIKPGFFTNDVLGELPALTRLLFAGLWVLCDREGRIEDRPKKIRAEVMPYDQFDADEHLESLRKAGFIDRYEVEGVRVIQVLAWSKHQNPHVKEAPSSLPAPYKNSASQVQEPDEEQPLPERAGLIPSLLIPDSLFLESQIPDSSEKKAPAPPWLTVEELQADGISEEVAIAFIAHRRTKKAKLTALAWKGFRVEVVKAGWQIEAAVLKAIARNWITFEAEWVKGAGADPAAAQAAVNAEAYRLIRGNKAEVIDG